jgi:hypothetical protein
VAPVIGELAGADAASLDPASARVPKAAFSSAHRGAGEASCCRSL